MMARRRSGIDHAALVALAGAAVAAFALARGAWAFLGFLPAMGASLLWRLERLPGPVATLLKGAGWIAAAAVAVLPVLMTFYGFVPRQVLMVAVPAGVALAALGTIYLFSAPGWTPASTCLPASIALLAAAGLHRGEAAVVPCTAVAALALGLHLVAGRRVRTLPVALFGGTAAAVALGLTFLLPWAQPWVESGAGGLLGTGGTAQGGLSLTSRLGDIEELADSSRVALRVWTDEPQNLRARVYTKFDGRSWNLPASTAQRAPVPAPPLDPELARWFGEVPGATYAIPGTLRGAGELRTRVVQDLADARVLPAPSGAVLVRTHPSPGWTDFAGVLSPVLEAPEMYAVVNRRDGDAAAAAPGEDLLQVPSSIDPRLRDLAARLSEGADPAERVRRTLEYLGNRCQYSLKVGAFRSTDPVGEFVFDKRKGYCEYFASAGAVLLRLQGVPARYVVGFSVRPSNFSGGHYVVRDGDAHAWVEAYLPDRGWVEVDPTPASQFEEARAASRGGAWAGFWNRLAGGFAEFVARLRQGGLAALVGYRRLGLGALAVVALLVGAWVVLRRRRRTRGPGPAVLRDAAQVPAELVELMKGLDRAWKRAGHPRPASRPPLEHLRSLPEAQRVGAEIVDCFYRCVYGGIPLSPADLRLRDKPSR